MAKPRRRMQPGPIRRRIGAPAHPSAAPKDFIEGAEMAADGEVVRLRYDSGDGTYQVAVMKRDNGETFTAVLRNAAAAPGERLAIRGTVKAHSSGELQLQSQTVARSVPSTRQGLVAFLSSGAIPGVGATMAERIVSAFGDDTMKVLDDAPQRLSEVEGIGPKRAASLQEAWREQSAVRHILIFLQSQGISPAYANRIHRVYGDRAVAIVKRNPYRLARDIHGIGFRIADRIAQEGGIKPDDLRRLQAGAEFALGEARGAGHIFVPREGLVDEATAILEADPIRVEEAIDSLVLDGTFVRERIDDHDAIYRRTVYDDEVELTESVARHIATPARMSVATPESLGRVESRLSFALAPGQRQALEHLIGAPMGVLTGGPGTGKTTIVRAIVEHAESVKATVSLAAPTGRAAQRLSESTRRSASTLHRLLGFDPQQGLFTRDASAPLEADLVIVDEASMIDQTLMLALIRSIAPGTTLLLVGDVEQLPSVGAGDILHDLIKSGVLPVARLDAVFRQAADSGIVSCAHAVRDGVMPEATNDKDGDFFILNAASPEAVLERVMALVTKRMPAAFGLDPLTEIQVLVPMHRGPVGTIAVNEALQSALGIGGDFLEKGRRRIHTGDKVMQVRNNYQLETFNGDIGVVVGVDIVAGKATVRFDGRDVEYSGAALDELELAYAVSVHKSQGSEFRAVVVVLTTHHFKLLQRNLLYTAITRARERLVIVGNRRAIEMAIQNVSAEPRFTGLAERLRERTGIR